MDYLNASLLTADVVENTGSLVEETIVVAEDTIIAGVNVTQLGRDIAKAIGDAAVKLSVTGIKIAALLAVQTITRAIIGSGGSGAIADWNKYLYTSPQQRAMDQMNLFFNTVSQGRLSSLNYEGVGPNYDAYL
ncbi:MAG: hypothetical protein WCI04_07315, partial [archaeon]